MPAAHVRGATAFRPKKFTFASFTQLGEGTQPFFCLHLAGDMSPLLTQSRGQARMNALLIRFDIPAPSGFSVNIEWDCPAAGWQCLERQTNDWRERAWNRDDDVVRDDNEFSKTMIHQPSSLPMRQHLLLSYKNVPSSFPSPLFVSEGGNCGGNPMHWPDHQHFVKKEKVVGEF